MYKLLEVFFATVKFLGIEKSLKLSRKTCLKWKYKTKTISTGSNMLARFEDQAFTEDHSSSAYQKPCNITEMYCSDILFQKSLNLLLATTAL